MRQRSAHIALVGMLNAILLGAVANAGGLTGLVTADGKTVAGARVQLNTGQIASTDARGRYSFADLPQATYALQVFAPGKEPVVVGDVVPGKGKADVALAPAKAPLGLVHVTATTPDGAACPVRLVTRWRAADGAEWQSPTELTFVSTLDARGRPFVAAEQSRPCIVPFGACLWTSR
jgi:hypothetical protein